MLAVLFLVLSAAVEVKASFFSANAGQEVLKNQPQGTASQDEQPKEEEDENAADKGNRDETDHTKTAENEATENEEEVRRDAQSATEEKLMDDMELEQMQDAVNELLGEESFSLEDALHKILSGEKLFSKEYFISLAKNLLYSNLAAERDTMIHVVLLVLLAALFSNFSNVFNNGQMGEISFYIVYMLLLVSLVHSFGTLSIEISEGLTGFVTFMKALMPSYFLAVTAATGSATAMVFYEIVLVLVYVVQVVFLKGVLPGIHIYVLLQLVNYLHSEDFLSKMAELVRTVVEWAMRTCIAVVIGMQIIQNMIGPAIDTLKRDVIGKDRKSVV